MAELPDITGLSEAEVNDVVGGFAGRGFLYVRKDGTVDLAHESVMWQWPELKLWIDEESAEAGRLRFYREAANKKVPLTGATLAEAQAAVAKIDSAGQWAARYLDKPGDVGLVRTWVEDSGWRQHDELKRLRRGRQYLLVGLAAALVMLGVVGWFWWDARRSKTAANEQLARNFWDKSRQAREANWVVEALQNGMEAISLAPGLREPVLLDLRALHAPRLLQMMAHQGPVNGSGVQQRREPDLELERR